MSHIETSELWLWRQIQAEKDERRRRERVQLRQLTVPPGCYGLQHGEEKIVTDCKGNRFLVIASRSAVGARRRHR